MKHLLTLTRYAVLIIAGLLVTTSVYAQTVVADGQVVDEKGVPLPGVTVLVEGTTTGTVTDIDGRFQLKTAQGSRLNISYIGYEPISTTASKGLSIKLELDNAELDEVVVIGYGSMRKKEVTGAVTRIDSESISNLNVADLGVALQGQAAGVSVTGGSGPGESSTIIIRGYSSVNGNNTPLYVVDGIPQDGDPRISSNEIESIDFLKDAASAAIYGSRGAAGVILITTKKGQEGKMRVSASANVGVRKITSETVLMNANEQNYFDLIAARVIAKDSGLAVDDNNTKLDMVKSPSRFYYDTDLLNDVVFVDNAITQNYNVTLSGGSKELKYSVVAGYYDEQGSVYKSGFDRFNTRAKLDYAKDKFTFGVNLNFQKESTQSSSSSIITKAIRYDPSAQPYAEDNDTYVLSGDTEATAAMNALSTLAASTNKDRYVTGLNFTAGYDISKSLKALAHASYSNRQTITKSFDPFKQIVDADGEPLTNNLTKSSISQNTITLNSTVLDFSLLYKRTFGDHTINGTAVATYENYVSDGVNSSMLGIINDEIPYFSSATMGADVESTNVYDDVLIGTIARLQYDYKGRYIISSSVRADGSSRFSDGNKWGIFPSCAVAWNISDEPFFAPARNIVSTFKLRSSYGTTGNQNFSSYSFEEYVDTGYDYEVGGELKTGATQITYANSDVMWETTKQLNIGIDAAFFKNRLIFNAEYYNSNKENMLFPIVPPGSTGSVKSVTLNVGNMVNTGYEFSANYNTNWKKLSISAGATFSTNKNEVTSINSSDYTRYVARDAGIISGYAPRSTVNFIAEGYEAGAYFLKPTNGIIKTPEQLKEYKEIDSEAKMGDLIYVDTDNDSQITDNDRVYCGSGLPKYEIGLNLTFKYKGFDLYLNMYSALGHEIINGPKATAYAYGRAKDLYTFYDPITNPNSTLPTWRGDIKDDTNYAADTDLWVEDGSYARLKNITIGYTLPQKVTNKIGIAKMRVYATGQDIVTITKYTGYDPEIGGSVSSMGLDLGKYPVFATYFLGVDMNF